jgi:hypothetical protein
MKAKIKSPRDNRVRVATVRVLLHAFYFYQKMPKFSLVSSAT